MRRVLLATALLMVAALAAPLTASSGQQSVKLRPKAPATVAAGAPIEAKIKVKDLSETASLVCIELLFEGDMLDPGEGLLIDLGSSVGAFGATNVSATPEVSRQLCTAQTDQLAAFLDGRESVAVTMEWGSVTVAGATVLVEP
jgi:hypothetical protein